MLKQTQKDLAVAGLILFLCVVAAYITITISKDVSNAASFKKSAPKINATITLLSENSLYGYVIDKDGRGYFLDFQIPIESTLNAGETYNITYYCGEDNQREIIYIDGISKPTNPFECIKTDKGCV